MSGTNGTGCFCCVLYWTLIFGSTSIFSGIGSIQLQWKTWKIRLLMNWSWTGKYLIIFWIRTQHTNIPNGSKNDRISGVGLIWSQWKTLYFCLITWFLVGQNMNWQIINSILNQNSTHEHTAWLWLFHTKNWPWPHAKFPFHTKKTQQAIQKKAL